MNYLCQKLSGLFDEWDGRAARYFILGAYLIIAAIFGVLFIENFIFSANVGLLQFREIDDLAFQSTLRHMHVAIGSGHIAILAAMNDYAYGSVFWSPLGVVTYPLWLLSKHFSIDWPLIVFPRQLQILWGIGGLYFLGLTMRRLGALSFFVSTTLLLVALFPSFDYFTMRFGTVNELFFFSVLTFYLAVKDAPSTPRGRKLIAFSLAIAGGIKLSGLLIAPAILVFIITRMQDRNIKVLIKAAIKPAIIFVASIITCSYPKLWLAPLHKSFAIDYFSNLSHFLEVTKVSHGETPMELVTQGFFLQSLSIALCFGISFTGLCVWMLRDRKRRLDVLAIMLGLFSAVGYLLMSVHVPNSISVYFYPVCFLLFMGCVGFQHVPYGKGFVGLALIILVYEDIQRLPPINGSPEKWGMASYFIKSRTTQPDLDESRNVIACMNNDLDGRQLRHIFVDYTRPLTINSLNSPDVCVSIIYDNLSEAGKYCATSLDYIVLDRIQPLSSKSDAEFQALVMKADAKQAYINQTDRNSRDIIKNGKVFAGQTFKLLCQTEKSQVFKASHL